MKYSNRNVLVVGELNEKLSFIGEFLGERSKTILREKVRNGSEYITVKNSESFFDRIIPTDNGIEIYSALVPFGINLYFDSSEDNWTASPFSDIGMVLFAEGYPFTTDSLMKNLLDIEEFLDKRSKKSNNICFRVLFHKERNRRFAAGDLVGIDEALKNAPNEVKRSLVERRNDYECSLPLDELVDFVSFSDITDIPKALVSGGKTMKYTAALSRECYRKWLDSRFLVDQEYAIKLMEYTDLTDPELIYNRITKYELVKGSRNIAEQYAINYYNAFAPKLHKLASEFYTEHIFEICFWNMEHDLSILNKRLDDLYSKKISNVGRISFSCPSSREEYNYMCSTTHLDIHFSSAVNEFVKKSISELIKKHLDEKEAALSVIFEDDAVLV